MLLLALIPPSVRTERMPTGMFEATFDDSRFDTIHGVHNKVHAASQIHRPPGRLSLEHGLAEALLENMEKASVERLSQVRRMRGHKK